MGTRKIDEQKLAPLNPKSPTATANQNWTQQPKELIFDLFSPKTLSGKFGIHNLR